MDPEPDSQPPSEKGIFLEALEISDPARRAEWLEQACGGDVVLRSRIDELLGSSGGEGDGFLEPDDGQFESALEISLSGGVRLAGGGGSLPLPHDFGDYELVEEIARGAMGVVYRARQKGLTRNVALKMIRSGLFSSENEVQRFLAEAQAAAALSHPHIVPIYEVGEHLGQHYFSMQLIDGGTLADHLPQLQQDLDATALLISKVSRALEEAHARGILHRDLKPGNILIDRAGEPHLTDFGLAKQLGDESSLTLSGQIMGTPDYMAPEQSARRDSGQLTPASDVYSLGAILFEVVSGKPPFRGGSVVETLRKAREEPVPRFARAGSKRLCDLQTIVEKCLAKSAAERYPSAAALADDLDRWRRGEPIEARPVAALERLGKWVKRKPAVAALWCTGAVLAVVLGVAAPTILDQGGQLEREAQAKRERWVETVVRATPHAARRALENRPEGVAALLEARLGLAESERDRVRLAAALAASGDVRHGVLLADVATLPGSEGPLVVGALWADRAASLREVRARFDGARDPVARARLAILALALGDVGPAAGELEFDVDPSRRTQVIGEFEEWHGALERLPVLLSARPGDAAFVSGLALAVGGASGLERIGEGARAEWVARLQEIYLVAGAPVVHSAAEWALGRLGAELPEVERSAEAPAGAGWYVTPAGVKMVRIGAGVVFPTDYKRLEETGSLPEIKFAITEPLFVSSGVIELRDYLRIVQQARAAGYDPPGWQPLRYRADYEPLAGVPWFNAVGFCNAASFVDGRDPAYRIDFESRRVDWLRDADGYRLLTEGEWEHAYRGGTETRFITGRDEVWLGGFGHIYAAEIGAPRRYRPNGNGLFDMLGNTWEMTFDEGLPRKGKQWQVNPVGQVGRRFAIRGGSAMAGSFVYHASARITTPVAQVRGHSFRVALGRPGATGTKLSAAQLRAVMEGEVVGGSRARCTFLAEALEGEGRWDEAVAVREALVARYPEDAGVAAQLAQAAAERKDWELAARYFLAAAERGKGRRDYALRAAIAFAALGDAEGCESVRRVVTELERHLDDLTMPKRENLLRARLFLPPFAPLPEDSVHHKMFRYLERDAVADLPQVERFHLTRVLYHLRLGDNGAALAALDGAGDLQRPEHRAMAGCLRALALARNGRHDDARRALDGVRALLDENLAMPKRYQWHAWLAADLVRGEALEALSGGGE